MQPPLLPRIARGDSAAVDEFLERYGGLVWSLAVRLARADAEDAVQEIFIDLWRNAGRFREEAGSEVAFVSTLARRRLIDRRRRTISNWKSTALDQNWADETHVSPVMKLEATEDQQQVRDCLGGLKDRDREVVELSVYEGQSQSQIAERLDKPLGTVKTLIRRALAQLRDCMRFSVGRASPGGVSR